MLLNCDMGESFGQWQMGLDKELMPFIDQANIACGFHASDPMIMDTTIKLAKAHNVSVGAHPGYQDLLGFGRRTIPTEKEQLHALLLYQIGAIQALCQANKLTLDYVKPHGALYNNMMKDEVIFKQFLNSLASLSSPLPLMIQAGAKQAHYQQLAEQKDITLIFEGFIDRQYLDDGSLMPRSQQGAVLTETQAIMTQANNLKHGFVISNSGQKLRINANSLCVHGDNPAAIQWIKDVSILLKEKDA